MGCFQSLFYPYRACCVHYGNETEVIIVECLSAWHNNIITLVHLFCLSIIHMYECHIAWVLSPQINCVAVTVVHINTEVTDAV